jgi:hypothetical protein
MSHTEPLAAIINQTTLRNKEHDLQQEETEYITQKMLAHQLLTCVYSKYSSTAWSQQIEPSV